jgi:hypothetical protein
MMFARPRQPLGIVWLITPANLCHPTLHAWAVFALHSESMILAGIWTQQPVRPNLCACWLTGNIKRMVARVLF